jgi:hypothetical protein
MLKCLQLIVIGALSIAIAPPAVDAAPRDVAIMVAVEDNGQDTVPRDHAIAQKVVQALGHELHTLGITMADATVTGPRGHVHAKRAGRPMNSGLLERARVFRKPPIDVIVVFRIHTSARHSADGQGLEPELKFAGRLIDASSGKLLASFEGAPFRLPRLPARCDRDCGIEVLMAQAPAIAKRLAGELVSRLDAAGFRASTLVARADAARAPVAVEWPPEAPRALPTAARGCRSLPGVFTLKFDGYGPREVAAIEAQIAAFPATCSLRPVRGSPMATEFWFETQLPRHTLDHNLRVMLDYLGVGGTIHARGERALRIVKAQ